MADSDFVVVNPRALKQLNMTQYLRHKKRARKYGEKQNQILYKGAPRNVNDQGLPIAENGAPVLDELGKTLIEVKGSSGEKIIYREESVECLHKNDSMRYESSMKTFIDETREHS